MVRKIVADARYFASAEIDADRGPWSAPLTASTLYVGGGTPSTLAPGELTTLVSGLTAAFGTPEEVSCEANPETAGDEWLAAAQEAGVNRLSLGVQTLNSDLARVIGRRGVSLADLARVRDRFRGSLSADLIIGIPGQTTADVETEMRELAGLPVEHLSVYDLSVEPGTQLAARLDTRSLDDTDIDWRRLCECAGALGLARYEVSSFAVPGHESRHNLGYWRAEPFAGLGPSAVSTLPSGAGAVRFTQTTDHQAFLVAHPFHDARTETLGEDELALETVMLGMRTRAGVCRRAFRARFGLDITEACGPALAALAGDGMLVVSPDAVVPTPDGMDLHNRVMERLAAALSARGGAQS